MATVTQAMVDAAVAKMVAAGRRRDRAVAKSPSDRTRRGQHISTWNAHEARIHKLYEAYDAARDKAAALKRELRGESMSNPAGIRAQVRRLPSGQVQIKIPLKGGRRGNPVYLEDVEGKPLSKRLVKLQRYGDHLLKSDLSVTEVAQRLRGVLGRVMDHATITVDDGKGHRAYNPHGRMCNPDSRPFYTIKISDVGKATIKAFGRRWRVDEFIGSIGHLDWGKRVYQTSPGVLQVENDEQFHRRVRNPGGKKYWQYPWVILLKSSATGAVTSLTEPHSRGFNTEREAQAYGKRLKRSPVAAGRHVELVRNTKVA